ncbi:MAG TPA: DUF1992 domain-containing protein [Chloroflexota bacterium]|jgi:DnaJ family protein C protein 28|nr:DUF1992 domain-containing protein [Chloroflexota bacterium]
MDRWYSVAEEKIREAMEQGEFHNLRGRGKPLKLERNPFEPPDLHMAHTILEAADMVPAWIDERKDIDRGVEEAVRTLRTRWAVEAVVAEAEFRATARELNRRILTYNLQVPSGGFQRVQIDVEWEIRGLNTA